MLLLFKEGSTVDRKQSLNSSYVSRLMSGICQFYKQPVTTIFSQQSEASNPYSQNQHLSVSLERPAGIQSSLISKAPFWLLWHTAQLQGLAYYVSFWRVFWREYHRKALVTSLSKAF